MIEKVFINKRVFECEDLNARELKLYLFICSPPHVKKELSAKEKMWVVGNNGKYYNEIPTYFDTLVKHNLITYDSEQQGFVSVLEDENFVVFKKIPQVKNLRQLFLLSLDKWHVKCDKDYNIISYKNPIISKELFHFLFKKGKNINTHWNNTNKQLGTHYIWVEQENGTILIKKEEENHEIKCNTDEDSHEITHSISNMDFESLFSVDMNYNV